MGRNGEKLPTLEESLKNVESFDDLMEMKLIEGTKPQVSKDVMNNTYKIKVKSPLLRAGLEIETECSEKYVTAVTNTLLQMVRDINKS